MSGNENGIDFTDLVRILHGVSIILMYQPISGSNVNQHIGHYVS